MLKNNIHKNLCNLRNIKIHFYFRFLHKRGGTETQRITLLLLRQECEEKKALTRQGKKLNYSYSVVGIIKLTHFHANT
jgi:hypothetical protein